MTPGEDRDGRTVYTDGACSGNPGPGGWAWVEPGGQWACGYDARTTNQRMELTAVLDACEHLDDPLVVVSDSTYVVNCWRDRWWRGWLKRDWRNSRKEPVANRDLWEQLVPHFRDREGLRLEWVKGHSGDRWNDLADRLAVGAMQLRRAARGEGDPPAELLASQDRPVSQDGNQAGDPVARADYRAVGTPAVGDSADDPDSVDTGNRSERRRAADPRVPDGYLVAVTGLRKESAQGDEVVEQLRGILAAQRGQHPGLVVITGLRRGAETAAAEAAPRAGVPYVVVLPYPDPTTGWPETETAAFQRHLEGSLAVVTLERKRPADTDARRKSLARRDGWLRAAVDEVVFLTDGTDAEVEESLRRWDKALGDDVWRLDVGAP